MKLYPILLFVLIVVFTTIAPLAAQEAIECEPGFRLFDDENIFASVCVPETAERIVTLDPFYSLQMSLELGLPVIGSGSFGGDNAFPETLSAEVVAGIEAVGTFETPNLEAITALGPDLIIGDAYFLSEQYELLNEIAPTVLITAADWKDWYTTIAAAAGVPERAEAAFDEYDARITDLQAQVPDDVTVSFLRIVPDGFQLYREAPNAYAPIAVMSDAGITRPEFETGTDEESFARLDYEGLTRIEGDILLYVVGGANDDGEELEAETTSNPIWQALPAVAADQAYRVDASHWMSFGGLGSAHAVLDDLFRYVAGVDPQEVSPNPFLTDEVEATPQATAGVSADSPWTIVDGTGVTLTFDAPPERIVCLYTRCMELLAALEFAPVGTMVSAEKFTTNPAYFPQPNEIALIDWDGDIPNMEQLIALQPDLVLGWPEVQAPLEGIAPVYNVVNEQDSYQESHDEIRAFARLLGREDIAEANITAALDRLEAYKRLSPGDVSIMDMFFSNEASYYRDGQSGTCNLLKEVAICDWPDPQNAATWSVEANDETLLQLDPDVLLISSYGFEGMTAEEIQATLSERPLWAELSAMKSGRIYVEPSDLNLDGMGTVGMNLMLDTFMPLLYPDVFSAPLTDEQVAEILAQSN